MASLEEKLQKWIVHESDGLCEGRMAKIPDISTLTLLREGKNKKIWKYFIEHVKSRQSVENIRSILRLKQARTELNHIYPHAVRNDTLALKQEVVNSQEKVQFVENSLKNIKYHVLSSKDSVQKLKEEACILNQKCTFLELVALNYHEKNETLKISLERLHLLLNYAFNDKKIMHFQKLHSGDSLGRFNLNRSNFEINSAKIKHVLSQLLVSLENKLVKNVLRTQPTNWNKSELACCISLTDVTYILKELSRQSEKSLKAEDVVSISTFQSLKEEMSSQKYLQNLKFEHVTSYFLKIKVLKDISNLPSFGKEQSNIQIILQRLKSPAHQEFILLKSENESLVESIKYLEEMLADLFNKTKCLNSKNDEQRAHCKQLKSVMQEFYRKLKTVQLFLDVSQQTFLNIQKALSASDEFMFTILFDNMTSSNMKFLSDSKNEMKFDFEMSMKLMERKDYLQPLLKESRFECPNILETVWESVTLPVYQNRQLICEKLIHLKKELSHKNFIFVLGNNIDMEEKHFTMLSRLQNIINHSKETEKEYVEKIRECRKDLEIIINEWWEQKAQFIPVVNCEGKSLKMWLDVLHVLDDF